MSLGEEIKRKREEKNLSQEELAERIGVSRQAVSKWESNLSAPTGTNRRLLSQELSFEPPEYTGRFPEKCWKAICAVGWGIGALFLIAFLCCFLQLKRASEPQSDPLEPALLSVHFYNEGQEEVFPEALWYNTAEVESILIQWIGNTPETVKMFYTPSGTETMEETELLVVKTPYDGENALLLSADPLHRDSLMGHVYFELNFGGHQIVTTDSLYNVLFDRP